MNYKEMMQDLRAQKVDTWFDLGLFLDLIRENNKASETIAPKSFEDYSNYLNNGSLAFLTFYFANDGVSVEINKYAEAFHKIFSETKFHYIAGEIQPLAYELIPKNIITKEISILNGFDKWSLYNDFFFVKLNRGSQEYNDLIFKFWKETLLICDLLGKYLIDNNIKIIFSVNVHSNPGNLSLALAEVIISEYLGIPVINNSHDFYWEGGNKEIDIKEKNLLPGPRDFFFKNSHIGEIFTLIELLLPWESRSWISVNINSRQSQHVININGHNPANVCEINTAINTNEFTTFTKRHSINTKVKLRDILSNYRKQLHAYAVDDFIEKQIINPYELDFDPFVIGRRWTEDFNFVNNNIILLQPTRIVKRKRIEFNFKIMEKLFHHKEFTNKFDENQELTLTLLISCHIPNGQYNYFLKLIRSFAFFLETMPSKYSDRVFLGFLFSEFDKKRFKSRYEYSITIPDLYNASSLVMLPSETEGRGLPILESCSTGIALVCNAFEPVEVFKEVTGQHLSDANKLKVLSFSDYFLPDSLIEEIYEFIFYPQNKEEILKHNRQVINNRYSYESLSKNILNIIKKLHLQLQDNSLSISKIGKYLEDYKPYCFSKPAIANDLIIDKNRHYLPGFGRMSFMILLKSLIDPSFFRVEEQMFRGMVFNFTQKYLSQFKNDSKFTLELKHEFYNLVDNIFKYHSENVIVRHDHAFNYRHRNTVLYPYQEFTYQELTGLVFTIFNDILKLKKPAYFSHSPHFFVDWRLAYVQLTNSEELGIDDRDTLASYLKMRKPVAFFPGQYLMYEMEFFILQPIRAQLGLKIEEELTENLLKENIDNIGRIAIFLNEFRPTNFFSAKDLEQFLEITPDYELKLLYKYKIFEIIPSEQKCVGIHINQLGDKALRKLLEIKNNNGFVIALGESAAMMTDIINMERFHLGKAHNELSANILGIKIGQGFVQYIPAGVRTTLAYPAPIQTAKDFSKILKKSDFAKLEKELGRDNLLKIITKDAEQNGTPIKLLLSNIQKSLEKNSLNKNIDYQFVSGVYGDGLPWNGVLAKVKINDEDKKWRFVAQLAGDIPKPVTSIIDDLLKTGNKKIDIAWNGGYILNPELVGKLGLPENYIGSPLGLLIMNSIVKSAPLFNKPAMLIYKNGSIDIQKVNIKNGFSISKDNVIINFEPDNYNTFNQGEACYFDLLTDAAEFLGNGNIILRLAGNTIKEIHRTEIGEMVKIIPVGLTLSIPPKIFNEAFEELESEVCIKLNDNELVKWGELEYAIEAGPLLIEQGISVLDMEVEGWKTSFSIRTQAARLDYVDMRGPKIAMGLNTHGELMVLVINGRIRESVGATHIDMIEILLKYGAEKAMGFDPGGSATLVIDGKAVNVSPYNIDYEKNNFALPGQPRFVANAILGYCE